MFWAQTDISERPDIEAGWRRSHVEGVSGRWVVQDMLTIEVGTGASLAGVLGESTNPKGRKAPWGKESAWAVVRSMTWSCGRRKCPSRITSIAWSAVRSWSLGSHL